MTVEERARRVEAALDEKGWLHLPASGWPGATAEQLAAATVLAGEVIALLAVRRVIQVHEDESGATIYALSLN